MPQRSTQSNADNSPSADLVRLHITPLTPTILSTLLPRSLFPNSTSSYPPKASFHTLPAFPEFSYGFVDLPQQVANKVTSRFNGSVFRGVKVRVQLAKARVWIPRQGLGQEEFTLSLREDDPRERVQSCIDSTKKKGAKKEGVYPGFELPEKRWVKRAWTKTPAAAEVAVCIKEKRERANNKGPRGQQKKEGGVKKGVLLFKTSLPPTTASPAIDLQAMRKLEKKRKRAFLDNEDQTKQRNLAKRVMKANLCAEKITIKEFSSNTKYPGFLKTSQLDANNTRGKVREFVEGVGWIDGNGDVVDDSAVTRTKPQVERTRVITLQEIGSLNMDAPTEEEPRSGDRGGVMASASELSELKWKGDTNLEVASRRPQAVSEHRRDASGNGSYGPGESRNGSSRAGGVEKSPQNPVASQYEKPHPTSQASSESESELSRSTSCASKSKSEGGGDHLDKREQLESKTAREIPSLKLAIPSKLGSRENKAQSLKALLNSWETAPTGGGVFNFEFSDDSDEEESKPTDAFTTPNRPYRSAAPTPDTAIVSKTIQWPDPAPISSEHTTPTRPEGVTSRKPPIDSNAPLLFQGKSDSAYLQGMSIWSGAYLPVPKALTELPPNDDEEEAKEGNALVKKRRKGTVNEIPIMKHKERKIGQGSDVARSAQTRKEVWKERFFKYRGEWNREWKNKKREAGKLARRKKRE